MASNNYTLGRGKVYFSRFKEGTQTPAGFDYIGNTPEFSLTIESDNLDHYSSDAGIKEKDDSVVLEVTRSGSFTTDHIDPKNLALFFFGEASTVTQAALVGQNETLEAVSVGSTYRLGITSANTTGYFGITEAGFAMQVGAVPLVENTDFVVDYANGNITFKDSAIAVANGDDVAVDFGIDASTRDRVISGTAPVEGAMMYVANNPKGENINYILPYVKVTPNGDYALKSDEWQTIPFSLEALKPDTGAAIYADGTPAFA